jgi:uncharacterized protein YecE (DUF72 family)
MRPSDEHGSCAASTHQRGPGDRCRIGTSGWHYPHWSGGFYPKDTPAKAYLTYYSGILETVEINSSFYRLPSQETLRNWVERTPPGFVFACKASRYITLRKKLKDPCETPSLFLQRIAVLGDKLGPVLFQLPPRMRPNAARLEGFLEALAQHQRFTFEFRDPRWHEPAVMRLLERYGSVFCCFDLGRTASPIMVTAGFVYIRLHGPVTPYRGSYSDACLADWAARIATWQASGLDVYCYFGNDERAYAPRNAQSLIENLHSPGADAASVYHRRSGKA